jgi:sulfur-carrier protein adenylyltransferase/sulfurtransferase
MDRGEPLTVVDVREPHEREIADLPDFGQKAIPLTEFLDRMGELDPHSRVVLYCRSGGRSAWAAQQLSREGYRKVWNLKGGVMGWRDEVDPTLEAY